MTYAPLFSRCVFLACLLTGWIASVAVTSAASKNIVLVVADDLGLDLGCYGNKVVRTPQLDQIAADATLFTQAYCTTASCSPSRSVLLTGMHNHANGQYGLEHSVHHFNSLPKVRSLSARLAEQKYRTARVGKYHVGPAEIYPFDEAIAGDARNGVKMADHCREFIASSSDRPFFLYFCMTDPHRSGQFAKSGERANLFGNEKQYPGIDEHTYDPRQVLVPRFLPDTPTCRAELSQYYQATTRADAGVGRLVQVLKDTGHWEDTLFVFVSDNGMPFPGAKTTTYDPGLHLPCLVRNPYAAKRGIRSQAMVSWVDIAPTILEFAGARPTGRDLHGRSLLPILEETSPPGWDEIYASHTFHEVTMYYPMRVVRNRRHKLIWNIAHPLPFPFASDLYQSATWQEAKTKGPQSLYGQRTVAAYVQRPQFELYDLDSDQDELRNLAADSAHAATFDALKQKLRDFQSRTGDPWLHKWDYE